MDNGFSGINEVFDSRIIYTYACNCELAEAGPPDVVYGGSIINNDNTVNSVVG